MSQDKYHKHKNDIALPSLASLLSENSYMNHKSTHSQMGAHSYQKYASTSCVTNGDGVLLPSPKDSFLDEKSIRYLVQSLLGTHTEKTTRSDQGTLCEVPQNTALFSSTGYREDILVRCIHNLTQDVDNNVAIENLLGIVGEYYGAKEAILFDLDKSKKMAVISHVWTYSEKIVVEQELLFVPKDELEEVLQSLHAEQGCVFSMPAQMFSEDSTSYKILTKYNINKVSVVPIYDRNKMTALVAVGDAQNLGEDLSLLHSISLFIKDHLKKARLFKQLELLSYTDAVTELYNRNKYLQRIDELSVEVPKSIGVLHVDVNGLKTINAVYGTDYGDFTLKQVARLLSKFVQQDLFRIGNGEFIAFCPNISHENFRSIISGIRKYEATIDEFSFAVGGAWQGEYIDITRAIEISGEIMRAEKQKYYLARPKDLVQSRVNSVEIILQELKEHIFMIYLQPQVNLQTGEIVGAEALIRKRNKFGRLVPPNKFVPMYENDGTIRHVDFFALEQVCIVLQKLIELECPLTISLNFSRVTFICYDLVAEIVRICQKYGIPHKYIRIEITENVDKMDYDFFENKIRDIKEAGFEVSLDDFGTKQSNFAMMTIPYFTEVKLDKMLLDSMDKSEKNVIIVKNIISMINELGMSSCVVEGIEREEQRQHLIELGCKYGQGFLFYKPLAVEEFMREYTKSIFPTTH